MPLSLRELDGRLRALEQLNVPQVKADLGRQTVLLEGTADDVREIKDSIKWVQRLVVGTVVVSIIGALLALAGLGA